MKNTGQLLKDKRESANLSISEVALATKINPKILTAIENGDSANLPAKTFLKGFLKSYALFLKMDVEEVLRSYQDETGGPPPERVHEAYKTPAPSSGPASPPPRRRVGDENSSGMRTIAVVVIVILIGLIIGVRELIEKYQREKVVESAQNLKLSPLAQPAVTAVPQVPQLDNSAAAPAIPTPSPALASDTKAVEQKLAEANEKAAAEKKIADEKKTADDKKVAEEKKAADEKKIAEEKKLAEEKKSAELKKAAEDKKAAEAKKIADEKKAADDKKAAAEAKVAEEKKAIEDKKAEEKKLAEEKKAADKKAADEKKAAAAEAKKAAAEAKAAEAKKAAEDKKAAADAKDLEDKKAADEKATVGKTTDDGKPALKHSEIILEALEAVEVKFQVKGETKRLSLAPQEVHTIHADNPVVFDFSDGGAVNIILNGHERGAPGDLGKPKQVTIP